MARIRKTLLKQGLSDLPVLITDTSPESLYFNIKQLSGVFSGGRNAFLISGTSFLKPNTEIFIEVIDSNGNSVFVEAIRGFVEANARLVVIEIYEDTPPGAAMLSIVGTARVNASTKAQLSENLTKNPNVRWQKKIIIEPKNKNITPLRLQKQPQLFVEEVRATSTNITNENFLVDRILYLTPQIQSAKQNGYVVKSSFSALDKLPRITGSFTIENRKYTYDIPLTTSSYEILLADTASVDLPLTVLNSTKAITTTNIIGNNSNQLINVPYLRTGSYFISSVAETSSNGQSATQIISNITSSTFYNYEQVTTTEILPEVESYLRVQLVDLNAVSGQISRAKTSFKLSNLSNDNEYTFLAETPLIVAEILVTGSENIPGGIITERDKWVGNFSDTIFTLRDNWYGHTLTGSSIPHPSYYTSSISESTQLTLYPRSNLILAAGYVDGVPNNSFFGTKNNFTVFPASEYTLKFTAIATASADPAIVTDMELDVYAVGSAIVGSDPLGQKIGSLHAKQASIAYFPETQFNFNVPREGDIGLRFIPRSGYWQYSYISLKVAEEKGFSPDETVFYIPNKIIEDSIVTVKSELFDINNNAFDSEILSLPTYITGSRRYVLRSGDTMSGPLDIQQGGLIVTGSMALSSGSDFYRWGHKLFNYGSFISTASQALVIANTPYSMSLTTTSFARGVSIVSGSRIVVENDGYYNLQFSAQLSNTANNTIVFHIWFAKNQQDILNSATKVELTKQSSELGKLVAAWNYMEYLTAGSYLEMRIAADRTTGRLYAEPANAIHPGVPSLIATIDQIA